MRRLTEVDGTGFLTYHLDGVGVKNCSRVLKKRGPEVMFTHAQADEG